LSTSSLKIRLRWPWPRFSPNTDVREINVVVCDTDAPLEFDMANWASISDKPGIAAAVVRPVAAIVRTTPHALLSDFSGLSPLNDQ
jgi:hypothetical protein